MVSNKAVRQAFYQALNVSQVTSLLGSGSASVCYDVVPDKDPPIAFPVCLFARQADTSTLRFGGNAFDSHVWMVRGIARDILPGVAEDIDAAARAILDFGTLTIAGAQQMHLARMSGIAYEETEGDQVFRHVGSLYRLVLQT